MNMFCNVFPLLGLVLRFNSYMKIDMEGDERWGKTFSNSFLAFLMSKDGEAAVIFCEIGWKSRISCLPVQTFVGLSFKI